MGFSVGVFSDWISTVSLIAREDSWDEVTPALQAVARIATVINAIKNFFLFMFGSTSGGHTRLKLHELGIRSMLAYLLAPLAKCMAMTMGSEEHWVRLHRKGNKYQDRRLPRRCATKKLNRIVHVKPTGSSLMPSLEARR